MNQIPDILISECRLTQHGMLVAFGHFANEIGLLPQLQQVPVPQKRVARTGSAKLATLFLGLLTGIEYLTDLTYASAPLYRDPEVARAWGLSALAEASGVSRTLTACTAESLTILQQALDHVMQPFLARALCDLRIHNQPLLLDVDLTGQPLSDTSTTYPAAAFGYMDGQIRLGYQIAELSLHTALYGRQWLVGRQHPGDTVSAPCLLELVQQAEHLLGCHPRRRVEFLDAQLAGAHQKLTALQQGAVAADQAAQSYLDREQQLRDQIYAAQQQIRELQRHPVSPRQHNPHGTLTQLQRRLPHWEQQVRWTRKHWAEAVCRGDRARAQIPATQAALVDLGARRATLAAQNAAQADAPCCRLRLDGGFSSGANLTALLELGYDVDTKAHGPGMISALRARVATPTRWTRVGKNAEMIAWPGYYMHTCPYPFTVGLERFHTPQGWQYSVLVRYHSDERNVVPDLPTWFQEYNARANVEAGIKQEKTVFHIQHPMSHSGIGMQIQIALTLFAANFVSWAQRWIPAHLIGEACTISERVGGIKHLVRVAANSPASVEERAAQVLVRFSSTSSLAGILILLASPAG